jgi:hypothetical protein
MVERFGELGAAETSHDSALTSTVGCARAAVCSLSLTNGAKVFECISAMNLFLSSIHMYVLVNICLKCIKNMLVPQ